MPPTWPAATLWLGAIALWVAFIAYSNWWVLAAAILMFTAAKIVERWKPKPSSCGVSAPPRSSELADQSKKATD